jgi:hypothetical protein
VHRGWLTTRTAVATGVLLALGACASSSGGFFPANPNAAGKVQGLTTSPTPAASPTPSPTPPAPPPTLPRGGRTIFPTYRVVAYYGSSAGPGLGILGAGTPDQAAAAVARQAELFDTPARPALPAMELIATVALGSPGPDGTYSSRGDPAAIERYLQAARRHKELLVLDFQPGTGDFLTEIKRFQQFVIQPDVGVAIDPEWHMQPGQVPGTVFGSATAADVNAVSAYLAAVVVRYRLPQKLFVIHQFRPSMLPDRQNIVARRGLATVFHADGNGSPTAKVDVYNLLAFPGAPFYRGFKLFFTRDYPLLTPQQTVALTPAPDLVTYQ